MGYKRQPQACGGQPAADDRAAAVFMERFYIALLQDHVGAAAALQRAQQEMAADRDWQAPPLLGRICARRRSGELILYKGIGMIRAGCIFEAAVY